MRRATNITHRAMWNVLIAALMGLAVTCEAQAAAMTIKLPAVTGPVGSEVKIPMNVESAKGCGALQFDLTYDPAVLEVKGVDEGALLSGAMLTFNVPKPGCLKVAMITQAPLAGDGVVAVVSFRVKCMGKSPLGLDKAKAWEHASNLDMLVEVVPGQFTVTAKSQVLWIGLAAFGLVVLVLSVKLLRGKRPAKVGSVLL